MKKRNAVCVVSGLVAVFMVTPSFAENTGQPKIFEKTYGEWSASWWQWLESQDSMPLTEHGNIDCSEGQEGPVWFLAGTDGTGPAERKCSVSGQKLLFFPLVSGEFHNAPDETTCADGPLGGPCTEAEKREILDGLMSDMIPGFYNSRVCNLETTVDGIPTLFANYAAVRSQSPSFTYLGDAETVSDGVWVMLSLPDGKHTLHFEGALCDLDTNTPIFEVDVTYKLTVR